MSDENENEAGGSESEEAMAAEWANALEEQGDEDGVEDAWAEAMAEQGVEEDDASPVELSELQDESVGVGDNPDLDVILDIPVSICMEVGSTEIAIRNLLQLSQGSVIELDRMAGEPRDIKVNGTLIAHGEVVVVNERFGMRLTDVVSPRERIWKLH